MKKLTNMQAFNLILKVDQVVHCYSLVPRLHSPAFLTRCEKSWGVEPGNEATLLWNFTAKTKGLV